MPQVDVSYTVEWSEGPKACYNSSRIYVWNNDLFESLGLLGLKTNVPFASTATGVFYKIKADETDPIHAKVWGLFREHGIELDKVPGFCPSRIRLYKENEYGQFEFLSLRPAGIPSIALFAENKNGTHVLYANERLKNKLAFASEEVTRVFYASDVGRDYLDAQKLVGIMWEPAAFDHPEKAAKKLHRLRSSITMPKCLTPIVDGRYIEITTLPEAEVQSRDWYDGGYRPPEMTFRRHEVEALGQFDVALTQEVVGGFPRWYHPEVIVSQRFRQVLLKMKNTSVGFNPVHLV